MASKSQNQDDTRASIRAARSVDRALEVLHALARAGGALSAQELAQACSIPRSSVYQLLNVMREHRFIGYDRTQRAWSLDVGVLEIGAAYLRSGGLQQKSWRHLMRLTTATGFTSHLAILDGPEVVYLAKRELSGGGIRLVTEVGTRLPARSTAVGKSILAHLTPAELSLLHGPGAAGGVLEPAEFHELVRELHAVRRDGYAEDLGHVTPGITCVAAPVIATDGRVIAALGVSYVAATAHDQATHATTVAEVRGAAEELSHDFAQAAQHVPPETHPSPAPQELTAHTR